MGPLVKTSSISTNNLTARTWSVRYTSLAVFLLGALSLVVPSGYSVGAAMLLLGSVVLIWRRPPLGLERVDAAVMATLAFSALIGMIWAGWLGEGWRDVDKPVRFLLALPALLLVMAYPPRLAWLWGGLAVGAIGAGGWAGWLKWVEGVDRASGHTHPIQFGNISMLLGVLCLAGLGWAVVQRHRATWLTLLMVGAVLGILGSLLSGSRGGWVGVPFILLVLYRAYGKQLSVRWQAGLLALVMLAGLAVFVIPQTGVQVRVLQAINDVANYTSGDNLATSIGLRFEMWKGAAYLITERPLLGWGEQGYRSGMQALADAGTIHPTAARYGHAHNEYLDIFVKRGVFGILSLLALYLVPLTFFVRGFATRDLSRRAVAVAGALLCVAYIDFSLTQSLFAHNNGTMMYAFLLAVLWGLHRASPPV